MTSAPDGLLQAAVALAPAALLRLLAGAADAGSLPAVRVHLSGGQILDGLLVKVGTDQGHDLVVLAGEHAGQLGYVLLANVVAVEVCAPEFFQDVLTGGRLPQPATGEPVTRLRLRRDFAPSEEFPLHVDWAALTDSGPLLANLGRQIMSPRRMAGRRSVRPALACGMRHGPGSR